MMAGIAVRAQESNLMIGAGLFGETGDQARNLFPGAVLRLSYGLDVRVGDKWSVMPGAGIRTQLGNVNMIGSVGGDMEGMSTGIIFQRGKHWQWGIEASVGLRNMLRQYPGYGISGAVHLHNLMFICGWRF